MDLKEQKYVCTLAECKSLTRASERLYISQPALSLYINNVEKILGARLAGRNQMPRRCAIPIRTCPAFSRSVCRLTASNCRSSSSI